MRVAQVAPTTFNVSGSLAPEQQYRLLTKPTDAQVTITGGPAPFTCSGLTITTPLAGAGAGDPAGGEQGAGGGTGATVKCSVPPEITVFAGLAAGLSLAGGIAEVSESLRAAWREIDPAKLTEYIARYGSGTVPKRLGYLAELHALEGASKWVPRWRAMSGSGVTLLERGGSDRGRIVTRWGLRINAGDEEAVG